MYSFIPALIFQTAVDSLHSLGLQPGCFNGHCCVLCCSAPTLPLYCYLCSSSFFLHPVFFCLPSLCRSLEENPSMRSCTPRGSKCWMLVALMHLLKERRPAADLTNKLLLSTTSDSVSLLFHSVVELYWNTAL